MSRVTLERAVCLLIHSRNSHGARRQLVRALIHSAIARLRSLS